MRRLVIGITVLAWGSAWLCAAQDQKPQLQPCVILKRLGGGSQAASHMYSFSLHGKSFQYVEGQIPEGVEFHSKLTDKDVQKIQAAGGRFVVLEPHYTQEDLEEVRKLCAAPGPPSPAAGNSPKAESKSATPAPATPTQTTTPATPAATAPTDTEDLCTAVVKSAPDGADITVDGKYMGSTPSTLRLKAGDHTVLIHKSGFQDWQRTVTASPGGIVTIDATLVKTQ